MGTGRLGGGGRCFGFTFSARHDLGAVSGAGREDAVVPYQVEPWWGCEGGQFVEQFEG